MPKLNQSMVAEMDKASGIKNKFKWSWLDQCVTVKIKNESVSERLSDYITKEGTTPGKCKCIYCGDVISYGSRGMISLKEHANKVKHLEHIERRRSNYLLSSAYLSNPTEEEHLVLPTTSSVPLTCLADRKVHSEVSIFS